MPTPMPHNGNDADVVTGAYAMVNGINLYYETRGEGEPLILLHGGVVGITMFGANPAALATTRKVIAVELQGHGHTADIDRPLSFEAMADDVAALIRHLGLKEADVLGYSLGGGVALQTVMRHPEVVRRLVVVAQPFKRQGWYPEVLEGMAQVGAPHVAEGMKRSPLAKLYPHIDWARLFLKLRDLLGTEYDWSKGVAAITAPTMLVFADADAVRADHMMEFFKLLGGGQRDAGLDGSKRPLARLAILPGLTHYDIGAAPQLAPIVSSFLDDAPVTRR